MTNARSTRHAFARAMPASVTISLLLCATSCTKPLQHIVLANMRPVIELTQAPANPGNRYFYAYEFRWFGADADGRIEHFLYAVDPPTSPGADTSWTETEEFSVTLEFSAGVPDSIGPADRSIGHHTFVVKAVDDDGAESAPASVSFFASTIAPEVRIDRPLPTALVSVRLPLNVNISWSGVDPDGVHSSEPVKYKWILLTGSSEFPVNLAIADPDSLRRFYAPDFAGWDSTDAGTRNVRLLNLTPGATYVFAVVGFDEAGAYSPGFSLYTNVLRFKADVATSLGPVITMSGPAFSYRYPSGGWSLDPSREIPVDVLPGQSMRIDWSAIPGPGTVLRSYRWKVGGDVFDDTQRTDDRDIQHWSAPALLTTSAVLDPLPPGEIHRFYLEAEDDNGLRSLGILRIHVLAPDVAFQSDILIVDDTRLLPDQPAAGGCVKPPAGSWPTAAELDTFLYARGGFPWRCYPPGTTSPPGIFAGYDFDTIGTTSEVLSFGLLARYRNVIWITDARSAQLDGGPLSNPTALRLMCDGAHVNSLAAYNAQGGRVWLLGAGVGYAASIAYDNTATPIGTLFPQSPGMFLYSSAGWRSGFIQASVRGFVQRSNRIRTGDPGAPSYARLPSVIANRTAATDPFPPNRAGQSPSVFYKSFDYYEFLSIPNHVQEASPTDPAQQVAVLDTLYKVTGLALPGPTQNPENVVMTLYRSSYSGQAIFTGLDLWDFTRSDQEALVDFVLQDAWGLPPRALPR